MKTNKWQDEWNDMPEYNNKKQPPPLITATFKFRSEEDYQFFKEQIKKYLYGGVKPFDGMQKKTVKNAWFPHKPKASRFVYEDKT